MVGNRAGSRVGSSGDKSTGDGGDEMSKGSPQQHVPGGGGGVIAVTNKIMMAQTAASTSARRAMYHLTGVLFVCVHQTGSYERADIHR